MRPSIPPRGIIQEDINEIDEINISDESKEVIIENSWAIFANAIVNLDEVSCANYISDYDQVIFHLKKIGKTDKIACSRKSYIKIANILKSSNKNKIL